MIRTHVDAQYEYFLAHFQRIPVRILRNRKTGEILFDADCVATCLGYTSTQEMMSQDAVLDTINSHINEIGESPLRKI